MPEVVAWLECFPFPSVALRAGTVTIGRADCDLVLPHKEISRRHLEVEVRPGDSIELLLRERSQNGTLLNGELVREETPLLIGDVITIGPFDIQVLATETSHAPGASDTDAAAVLSGRFRDVPLSEVVADLELCERTGILEVVLGTDRSGRIVVVAGRPVAATLGPYRDAEAVLAMLVPTTVGRFLFRKADRVPEGARLPSFTQLRLEASRREDEGIVTPTPPHPPKPEPEPEPVAHVPTFESRRLRIIKESPPPPTPTFEVKRVALGPVGAPAKGPRETSPAVEVRRVGLGPVARPDRPKTAAKPAIEVRRVRWGPTGPRVDD